MNENDDLINNGILPDSISRKVYEEFRKIGLEHKKAVEKTVRSVDGLYSEGIDQSILDVLKDAIFKIPGTRS